MAAGGNFWDDATVGGVDINLADNNIAENFLSVFDDGGGCFIAGAFDTKDVH